MIKKIYSIAVVIIVLSTTMFVLSKGNNFDINNNLMTTEAISITSTNVPNTSKLTSPPTKTHTTRTTKQTTTCSSTTITHPKSISISFEVPNLSDFKSWTNYNYVSKESPQWNVLTGDSTYTDDNGFRRKDKDYLVAMGSYYTKELGERFRITTNKGNIFTVTICDWKADCDTDSKGQYTIANNCIVEFYVDDNLCNAVRNSGSCSSIKELSGKITKIEKIK